MTVDKNKILEDIADLEINVEQVLFDILQEKIWLEREAGKPRAQIISEGDAERIAQIKKMAAALDIEGKINK